MLTHPPAAYYSAGSGRGISHRGCQGSGGTTAVLRGAAADTTGRVGGKALDKGGEQLAHTKARLHDTLNRVSQYLS